MDSPKANKAELEKRVTQCLRWIREGYSRLDAVREGSGIWKVSERQCDDYFSAALKKILVTFEKKQKTLIAEIDDKMDHVYKDALVEKIVSYSKDGSPIYSKDLNVARQILMDKAKLCGLLKEQVEISGSVQTGLEETNDDDFETAFPPESELRS